jgi:hypothetical protein
VSAHLLPAPVRWWRCPSCGVTDRTERADVHTQFHPCPALGGVTVPLVEVRRADDRPDGRHLIVPREDYSGNDTAGPIAAIRTERGDGSNDCTVLAPTATAGASS